MQERGVRVQATVRLEAIRGQGSWKVRKQRVAWPDGDRMEEASGEWPVSYHGTDIKSAECAILQSLKRWFMACFSCMLISHLQCLYNR